MRFTKEEFDTMVYELLYKDPSSCDMLVRIAEKTVKNAIKIWCYQEPVLRNRGYEDDIFQETYLKLMKNVVSNFFLRDGIAVGEYNDNPEGFEDWMFTVAKNAKNDFVRKVGKEDEQKKSIEDITVVIPHDDSDSRREQVQEKLKESFEIIMSSNLNVYKILTWVAQCVFMSGYGVTKIKSNELIIQAFENKTLNDMYDMILSASKRIPWMVVTPEQDEKIKNALKKEYKDNVSYGETKYKEFYMLWNGEPSGKKSISDWMNRLSEKLKKEDKKPDKKPDKKNDKKKKKASKKPSDSNPNSKKGGNEDETSGC